MHRRVARACGARLLEASALRPPGAPLPTKRIRETKINPMRRWWVEGASPSALSSRAAEPLSQSATRLLIQPISSSVSQSLSHSVSESISESITPPLARSLILGQPLARALTQAATHAVSQPLSQALAQPASPSGSQSASQPSNGLRFGCHKAMGKQCPHVRVGSRRRPAARCAWEVEG